MSQNIIFQKSSYKNGPTTEGPKATILYNESKHNILVLAEARAIKMISNEVRK
jgi:hypothetical protein